MKEPWEEKVQRIQSNSPYGHVPNWSILHIHTWTCVQCLPLDASLSVQCHKIQSYSSSLNPFYRVKKDSPSCVHVAAYMHVYHE